MNLYTEYIMPQLTHWACSRPQIMAERRKMIPLASGLVVELGFGSGLNLPFYDRDKVSKIIGVNPPDPLLKRGEASGAAADITVEILAESAEALSIESDYADTVVVTYTFCSIPDVLAAMSEARRILKPIGQLLFVEHGRSDDPRVARWQDRINPIWNRFSCGCHINRNPTELLATSGFRFESIDQYVPPGLPSLAGYHHRGIALPA